MRTNRQKHCSLWLCRAIVVLIHGLDDKSDTVVEFDSDRCFFYCDCLTSGNSACLSTAAAMLSYSHEITSKNDYYSLFFYAEKALASLYICIGSPASSSWY